MRIQDTKTWRKLDTADSVWVYEHMTTPFLYKIVLFLTFFGGFIYLAEKWHYRKKISAIRQELNEEEQRT